MRWCGLIPEQLPMLLLQLANVHRGELLYLIADPFLHASTSWT